MKKLLISLGLIALGFSASAQSFQSRSFLNCLSAITTNTIQLTNITSITSSGSNVSGTVFTNLSGTQVVVAVGTNDNVNLLKTLPIYVDRNSVVSSPIYTNQAPGAIEMPGPSFANIYIRIASQSGANSTLTFTFRPVPSDGSVDRISPSTTGFGVEDLTTGDVITIAFTVTASSTSQALLTKLDARKLVGCKGIMLQSIVNADTDATSAVTILECSLNGFVP